MTVPHCSSTHIICLPTLQGGSCGRQPAGGRRSGVASSALSPGSTRRPCLLPAGDLSSTGGSSKLKGRTSWSLMLLPSPAARPPLPDRLTVRQSTLLLLAAVTATRLCVRSHSRLVRAALDVPAAARDMPLPLPSPLSLLHPPKRAQPTRSGSCGAGRGAPRPKRLPSSREGRRTRWRRGLQAILSHSFRATLARSRPRQQDPSSRPC